MSETMRYDDEEPVTPTTAANSTNIIAERAPTPEEVQGVFQRLLGESGKEFRVSKTVMDERGLYELEIETPGAKEGEITEYAYRRDFGKKFGPEIHTTYYKDGMPVHGTSTAKYVNGQWEFL